MEIKELVSSLVNRSIDKASPETRKATGYIRRSDMSSLIKWGVTCESCPLSDSGRFGKCLTGFTYESALFETARCSHLISMSKELPSKENLDMEITCR